MGTTFATLQPSPTFAGIAGRLRLVGWKPNADVPIGWSDIFAVTSIAIALTFLAEHACCLVGQGASDPYSILSLICSAAAH